MPADGLRAAYENYHALRQLFSTRMDELENITGQIAEAAAAVVKHGGEI